MASLLLDMGCYDQSIERSKEAESLALHLGNRTDFLICRTARADALNQAGRPAEAAALIEETLKNARGDIEPSFVGYAKGTIAESLLEGPRPPSQRIKTLIKEVLDRAGSEPKLRRQALLLALESRARPDCAEEFEPVWREYQAHVEREPLMLHPPTDVRANLASALAQLKVGRAETAVNASTTAARIADENDIPAFGARAYSVLAEAQEQLGDREGAIESVKTGQALLEQAANRIKDPDLRRDFLDRPVFRALRKSRLIEDAAGEDRLMAIYDMIRALNSESDPDALLESMLDMALRVVRAERGMILLRGKEDEDYAVRLARNLEQETIRDATKFSRSVVLEAGAGKPVLAMDTGSDTRLRQLKSVSMYGIRSVLCVPLRSRGKIIGAVYLDSRAEGSIFTADDLRFLEAFADHAALALENAQIRSGLERENLRLQVAAETRTRMGSLWGRSAPMQSVYDLILKVSQSRLPVLIQGESGTGKELVARAIHAHGPRRRRTFLSENCAAIPETLLESELFGHVKGAFTGADRDHQGLFEQADGGTLFLDEVGDMSTAMQARLLRVLQEGELRRVGAERPVQVDVRVLAATNRVLQEELAAGRFREDLFYRLQVLVIQLPPLRERPGDVPLLVEHFLARISEERGRSVPSLQGAVMDQLERYNWPGNVRQLENVVQRLALLGGDGSITLEVVKSDRGLRDTLMKDAPAGKGVYSLARNEREQIRQALKAAEGNRTRAAKMLGISRATIFRKIKEHGLA
jgi:transcriptional regulator with GAF, ATPase, and Fis domain